MRGTSKRTNNRGKLHGSRRIPMGEWRIFIVLEMRHLLGTESGNGGRK